MLTPEGGGRKMILREILQGIYTVVNDRNNQGITMEQSWRCQMSSVNVMSMSNCQKSGHVNDKEIGINVCVNQ